MSEVIRITPEVVIPVAGLEFRGPLCLSNLSSRARGVEWPRCSFCCSSTGPFSEVEGLWLASGYRVRSVRVRQASIAASKAA